MADVVEDPHVQDGEMTESSDENTEETKKPTILDHFSTLQHSNDDTERVDKTIEILRLVHGSENENQRKYTLTRLIRGLAASRFIPKRNFYVALTQLLRITPSIEVPQILEIVKNELVSAGKNSKSENADIYFGEILLCGSLIRSGTFKKATQDEQKHIVEMLLKAGKKRHYLSLAAYNFILEIYDGVTAKDFKLLWNIIKPELEGADSVDYIYFILKTQEKYPKIINAYLLEKQGSPKVFTKANMKEMMDKLLKTPWLVKTEHPIYQCIGKEIMAYGIENWCDLVDEYMQKSHTAMHAVMTILITNLLEQIEDASQIPLLFTPNYLHFTFNCYRSTEWREDCFIKMMQKLFTLLEKKLVKETTSSDIKMQILSKFLHFPGDIRFDSLTKSKIVHVTTNSLDTEGVKSLVKLYKEILLVKRGAEGQTDDSNDGNSSFSQQDRSVAAISMIKLLKHQSLAKEKDYKLKMIKFFLKLVFLNDEKFSNVSNGLAGVIKPQFFSILDQKFGKLEDQRDVLLNLINHLDKKISSNPEYLRVPLSEEKLSVWQEMITFSKKLTAASQLPNENFAKLTLVFHILCLQMGFQIFRDFKLAATSLKDIINCYDESKKQMNIKKRKKKKSSSAEDEAEQQITWIEVVVDLFLNFLSLDSHLLRNVVSCVFPHLCPHINKQAMKQILEALFSDDENPLSTESDSEDEGNESGEDDDAKNESDSNGEDDGQDSSDDEEDEDADIEEDKLQPLRMACSQALGMDGATSDCESVDVDDISEEEGRKIDEMLAECFKSFKPKTQKELKQEEKKETGKVATFRIRVLDLLAIYLDTEPNLKLCFDMLPYLIHATYWSIKNDNQGLTNRLNSVLGRMSKLKKAQYHGDVTLNDVGDRWAELFGKNEDLSANLLRTAMEEIVFASVFVLRGAQIVQNSLSEEERQHWDDEVFKLVSETLERLLNENDALVVVFLTKLFDISYANCARIAQVLISYAYNKENNWFKRCRVFKLVFQFYTNNRLLTSQYEAHPKVMKLNWKVLSENSLELLQNGVARDETDTDSGNSRYKFMEILFCLLVKLKNGPLKAHFEKFDWEEFGNTALRTWNENKNGTKIPQHLKYAFKQLCAALKISVAEKRQRSANEGNSEAKNIKKKQKKAVTNEHAQGLSTDKQTLEDNAEVKSDLDPSIMANGMINGYVNDKKKSCKRDKRSKGAKTVQQETTKSDLKVPVVENGLGIGRKRAKNRQSVSGFLVDISEGHSSEEFQSPKKGTVKNKRSNNLGLEKDNTDVTNSSSQEIGVASVQRKSKKMKLNTSM